MKTRIWLLIGLLGLLSSLASVSPVAAADESWYAEYFSNATLSGGPALTRYETTLHYEWGLNGPGNGLPVDGFSLRLTRDVWFEGGTYRFSYKSDDGLRLWIDNSLVIDNWRDQSASLKTLDQYVSAGVHRVRIEYYDNLGLASLQVSWSKLSGGDAWRGNYFANMTLSGTVALVRDDTAIDFDWRNGSPDPALPADRFSVRWTRTLGFEAGTYRFYAASDDGVRIYVDGKLLLNVWQNQKLPNTHSADMTLKAGSHEVIVEYFEDGGEAGVHVWWNRTDTISGWQGRYYDNRDLRGGPAMIRDDAEINFDWGERSPASWIPSDNFSVQWIKQINLAPGLYRFNARADDGIRLWIDDVDLRLNYWQSQDFAWRYQDWHWLEGPHTLRFEYYEQNGSARVQFWWDYAATIEAAQKLPLSSVYRNPLAPSDLVPEPTVKPGPAIIDYPGPWKAEYYATRDFTKAPKLERTDEEINFDWVMRSPGAGIPTDQFAVRWIGTFSFTGGRYRFTTVTDDGVRIYLDDVLILESWRPMRGTRTVVKTIAEGEHTVRIEYFEALEAAKAQVYWTWLGNR